MANFNLSAPDFEDNGYTRLLWDNSEETLAWYAWRVYRRRPESGTAGWRLLTQITQQDTTYEYRDYTVWQNEPAEYALVHVSASGGGGGTTEGSYSPAQSITPEGTKYWLIHPTIASRNVRIDHVTADSFQSVHEEEEHLIIGRGRKIDRGENWGVTGSLSASFRGEDARQKRQALQWLVEAGSPVHLRNPFGDSFKVFLFGGVTFDREGGVGVREFGLGGIEYREVF